MNLIGQSRLLSVTSVVATGHQRATHSGDRRHQPPESRGFTIPTKWTLDFASFLPSFIHQREAQPDPTWPRMDEPLRLPLRPNDNSIQSHLLALDLLSARLAALPSSTRWAADVPLNSKATVRGQLIHTNEIKVHLVGEWWVEMTADEAAAYVRRRRHGERGIIQNAE